jgi:hypothetical protein
MIAREFQSDPRVAYASLAELLDVSNPDITFDGMHLNPAANAQVADALVEPLLRAVNGAGVVK